MEASYSSDKSAQIYHMTRHHIPEEDPLPSHVAHNRKEWIKVFLIVVYEYVEHDMRQ
jgi:hypothetical protein